MGFTVWVLCGWIFMGYAIFPKLSFEEGRFGLDVMGVIVWLVCGATVGPIGVIFLFFEP